MAKKGNVVENKAVVPAQPTAETVAPATDEKDLIIADLKAQLEAAKVSAEAVATVPTPVAEVPVVKVIHGVNIPRLGVFSKAQIEANQEIQAYLLDIGSGAVEKIN